MKMKPINNMLFCCIVSLLLTSTVAFAQFSGGNGTYSDPYKITSKQDMEALADSISQTDY